METVTSALGLAWAFSCARMLGTRMLETIHDVAIHVGHTLDALHVKNAAHIPISIDGPCIFAKHSPYIVATCSDPLIIYKPPGWQVDEQ